MEARQLRGAGRHSNPSGIDLVKLHLGSDCGNINLVSEMAQTAALFGKPGDSEKQRYGEGLV